MKDSNVVKLVRVRFPGQILPGTFLVGNHPIQYGDKVVAMSDRGITIGYVNSQIYEVPYSSETKNLQTIQRPAIEEDVIRYKKSYQDQREAGIIFNSLVQKHGLPMNLQEVEYVSCGQKIIFEYTAPDRVDFRELLKDLARELRSKIELRQVAENSQTTGIGPCGPDLCQFINSVVGESARRTCSGSYCCLEDNDKFYREKRSRLPKVNALVAIQNGEIGKVRNVDLVKEEFEMLTEQGIIKRYVSEMYKETLDKKKVLFPKEFEFISHDTRVVIGQAERAAKREKEKEIEFKKINEAAREFAEEVWKDIS